MWGYWAVILQSLFFVFLLSAWSNQQIETNCKNTKYDIILVKKHCTGQINTYASSSHHINPFFSECVHKINDLVHLLTRFFTHLKKTRWKNKCLRASPCAHLPCMHDGECWKAHNTLHRFNRVPKKICMNWVHASRLFPYANTKIFIANSKLWKFLRHLQYSLRAFSFCSFSPVGYL